jgi:hypothetical protein
MRGLSAIRAKSRPGKFRLVQPNKLPKPVLNREELTTPTKHHGLMGFFNKEGTLLAHPEDDGSHGIGQDMLNGLYENADNGHRQRVDC